MKIAVTARGPTPESALDERLGRAYWLLIHDRKQNTWTPLDNSLNRNALQGAGYQTARILVEQQVALLVTGEIGPKAFRVLQEAGIAVFPGAMGTVQEALSAWEKGHLAQARAANEIGSPYCLMGERHKPYRIVG